jgi:hypothetical protein
MNTTYEMKSGTSKKCQEDDLNELGNSLRNLFDIGMKSMAGIIQNMGAKSPSGHSHCHDPWLDCYPCGPLTSNTDLKVEGRYQETRVLSFLIENNRKVACDVNISVDKFFDACGIAYPPEKTIIIRPPALTIQPGDCGKIHVAVKITAPLKPGQVYYAELKIEGACCVDNISLGIWVEPDNYADYITYCDPCKPKIGKFVDFVNCECCMWKGSSSCKCCNQARTRTYYVAPGTPEKPEGPVGFVSQKK